MKKKLTSLIIFTFIIWALPLLVLAQGTLKELQVNGPTDKRLNVVFFAEAYTSAQESQFDIDAVDLMNYMNSVVPLGNYSTYFNFYSIWVPSNESGADHPSSGILRDTYFSATYDSYAIQRLITIPPNDWDGNYSHGAGKVDALLATHMPEYDIVVLIVNDPVYGGSGGTYAITSTHSSAPEIFVHELGHSHGILADEYDYGKSSIGRAERVNVTQQTNPVFIKWRDWILPSTPIPTPETSMYSYVVGLFQGANYDATNWYRPRLNCKMNTLGPAFCEICKEQLVKVNYQALSPIQEFDPVAGSISIDYADSVALSISPMRPVSHDLKVDWYFDTTLAVGESDTVIWVKGIDIGVGWSNVKASVTDTTSMVIIDPTQLLKAEQSWAIEVTAADSDADGVADPIDNCISTPNPGQEDYDNDGIGDACCCQKRADFDHSGEIDITDLTAMVDFLFRGGVGAPCPEEANVDNSPEFDITDLTSLVDYLFKGGPDPAGC